MASPVTLCPRALNVGCCPVGVLPAVAGRVALSLVKVWCSPVVVTPAGFPFAFAGFGAARSGLSGVIAGAAVGCALRYVVLGSARLAVARLRAFISRHRLGGARATKICGPASSRCHSLPARVALLRRRRIYFLSRLRFYFWYLGKKVRVLLAVLRLRTYKSKSLKL